MAEPYRRQLNYAYIAANLGYSKLEYYDLTPLELALLPRAIEQRTVGNIYAMYRACYAAFYNVLRKKGKRALKPITKGRVQRADMEVVRENIEIARQVIAQEGDAWVARVYQANGLRRPQKKKEVGRHARL